MTATIEWFGVTTFRVQVEGLVLFFDAYLDKMPGAKPGGLPVSQVTTADFVFITHAHFDHLYGADKIALQTGATMVGNPTSIASLRANGVPDVQLLEVTGGETVDCGHGIKVRVLPSLHSCLFAHSEADYGVPVTGDLGISAQARAEKEAAVFTALATAPAPIGPSLVQMLKHSAPRDGGPLAFVLGTAEGSVLFNCSAGYWRGIFRGLDPDVALLAVGGRPNLDGEPHQGSTADFILQQLRTLGHPKRVALCHWESLLPGLAPDDNLEAAVQKLAVEAQDIEYLALEMAIPRPLFG